MHLVFDATPGPAVVIGLANFGDRFCLVVKQIEVVGPEKPLPRLPAAMAVWRAEPSRSMSAECWLKVSPHHTVPTQAADAESLRDFEAMAATELVLIDSATTPETFGDRVCWSSDYRRLAAGMR